MILKVIVASLLLTIVMTETHLRSYETQHDMDFDQMSKIASGDYIGLLPESVQGIARTITGKK